jgi:signal transduction histidine kinase
LNAVTRALATLALTALLAGLLGASVILGSDHVSHRPLIVVLLEASGAAWIGAGLFAWWRRPCNRTGALMTWTGFAWLLNAFLAADSPAVFTAAVLVSNLYLAAFVHLLLAYPEGRLGRRRPLAVAAYALALLGPLPELFSGLRCDCPDSILQVTSNETVATVGDGILAVAAVVLAAAIAHVLYARWRRASAPRRRMLAPLLWSGLALLVLIVGTLGAATVAGDQVPGILGLAGQVVFASVPFTFLFVVARGRFAQAEAVSELLKRLGERSSTDGLRGLLVVALEDPSLELLYWLDGGWVRRDGRPAELRGTWTPVELEGQRVGAIVHDKSLEPDALEAVAAAAGLAMRGEQLEAALRRSRARIVEVGLAERRRLERNLHDGAQQRLVALSLSLRIAQNQIAKAPEKAAEMVGAAQEELTRALEELR